MVRFDTTLGVVSVELDLGALYDVWYLAAPDGVVKMSGNQAFMRLATQLVHYQLVEGFLQKKQCKLVLAWAVLHQNELMADWDLVMQGAEPLMIQPLK